MYMSPVFTCTSSFLALTGAITTIADLDFETDKSYQLVVRASDQGSPQEMSELLCSVDYHYHGNMYTSNCTTHNNICTLLRKVIPQYQFPQLHP